MVNYVLSFCKITGASKIFTRNFYLPLLKPLTPREALRTLRITGKWLLGAKIQHYIPVLLHHSQKRLKGSKNYGKIKHEKMDDYTYMTPVFDPENENHNILLKILESKSNSGVFVYTVEDKKYNIVLQAQFEVAIRDGDIIDVLVSQKNDKIIVKMKDFKKVPMEIQYFEGPDEFYYGEGATSPEEEKFHHHGKYTMGLAKIFEDKEMREEKWEAELKKIMKRKKKHRWENSKAYKEMMKRNMKNMNWKKFEEDAKRVIEEINEPATEQPIEMEVDDLDATKNVNETILRRELLNQLPTITEIPDIIKNLGNACLHEIEDVQDNESNSAEEAKRRRVSGVKVTLPSGKECFVSGQMVHTEEGEVFVPGQTIENEFGDEYAPGITINIDNKPTLLGGLIMGEEQCDPMFLPSQSTITADGQLTFASAPEERPPPQPESERKLKRKLKKKVEEENITTIGEEDEYVEANREDLQFIIMDASNSISDDFSESEEKSMDASSIELNNSELEELDIEAITAKQEQQRLELEQLKLILMDDGMDDIIASLEDKKNQLNKKLEELRKLSMNAENNLVTYASEDDALEIASRVSEEKDTIIRISDILLTMTRRAATFRDKNSVRTDNINNSYISANATETDDKFNACSNKLKVLFKTAIVAANDVFKNRPKDQLMALGAIGEILVDALKKDNKLLREFLKLMNTQFERNEVCNTAFKQLTQIIEDTKMAMLGMITNNNLSPADILENIAKILESENVMNISFTKMIKISPEIVKFLKENIICQLKNVRTEEDAVNILQNSIVKATKSWMDREFEKIKTERKESSAKALIEEAASFAKALSFEEIVKNLSEPNLALNYDDAPTTDMLKRIILIKQLAERDYSLKTAITRIKKNPECAKSDPRIRQLIRESAVLISDLSTIRNSRDIPLQLMKKQNVLAIEDFLLRKSKFDYPVLISRGSLQAVIPKDAARGVLAGRVPYILIDESGVTNFKPMHMISAVQVNRNRERRIDDYLSGVRERSSDRDDARTYLQAKSNGSDTSRQTMSSGALFRGYTGPRA